MRVLEFLIRWWGQVFCGHQWVSARWDDGSYGYRCRLCLKAYPVTWNDVLAQPVPVTRPLPQLPRPAKPARPRWSGAEPGEELKSLGRAA